MWSFRCPFHGDEIALPFMNVGRVGCKIKDFLLRTVDEYCLFDRKHFKFSLGYQILSVKWFGNETIFLEGSAVLAGLPFRSSNFGPTCG
jgi:hypothetical protein